MYAEIGLSAPRIAAPDAVVEQRRGGYRTAMTDAVWDAIAQAKSWLDDANGSTDQELTCRILKVTEEAGEVAGAWIGVLGQNPRKGVTHGRGDVVNELADVAMAALVAIASLGHDPREVMERCAAKVASRSATKESVG